MKLRLASSRIQAKRYLWGNGKAWIFNDKMLMPGYNLLSYLALSFAQDCAGTESASLALKESAI